MNNEIILLFNDYYQLYLNGLDSEYIINSFILKTFDLIDKNKLIYDFKIINSLDASINDKYIYNLEFSGQLLGYLKITLNYENKIFIINNLFLSYLSILMYNCKYIKRPTPVNCSIFNEILNNIKDGIIITDTNFNILFSNSSFKIILNLLKYTNVTNLNFYTIFPILESQLERNNIFKNRKIHYDLNIDTHQLNLKFVINTLSHNDIFYNLIIVTNRKKEIIKNDNISLLSHELRNPLQSINLANYLLQNKSISDDIKKYLDIINKATYDMKKIINDVYDISKIDSNEIMLSIENINIHELISDIIFDFNQFISKDNIEFNYKIDSNVPEYLFTDSTRLKQIIMNLLGNSIKYSKIDAKNNIIFTITFDNQNIKFIIEDRGIGIKENEISNLFKFKSITSNNNIVKCNSNGYGLYICNKLAQLLGGKIEIKSTYMIGTTFIIIHPLKLGNNDIIFKKKLEELIFNGKILIVDDNEQNAELFKNIIDNLKFSDKINSNLKIDICLSGEIAIDMCKLNTYDIIFMDINMKGIDGINTSKILRKNNFSGKIIAATGNVNTEIDKNIFNDRIIKPFDDTVIIDMFQKFL